VIQESRTEAARAETSAEGALPLVVVLALAAGPFLSMVDSSIVNVAVPDIAHSLRVALGDVQWTVSAYLLALSSGLAATAWLAKRLGPRPVYLGALAGFTAASATCALAPSIQVLVAARAAQGLLGAPLIPIAMGMLTGGAAARARQRSQGQQGQAAMLVMGILLFAGPAAGPTLGGVLIGTFGWPSIFLVNVPFGILGLLGALQWRASRSQADPGAPFDPAGMVLLAGGLGLALYGAGQGPAAGWLAPRVWPFWTGGVLLVIAYVAWALRSPHPAVNLRLLRDRLAAVTVALSVLVSVVSFAALFLLPVYMQAVQGYSALQAGLALLPQGLVMGVGTVAGQRVANSGRLRLAAVAGSAALAVTTAALLLIDAGTPAWLTGLILCGRGLAFGLATQPLLVTMMGRLSGPEVADGSTLFNVVQRVAGSFGIGLLATLFAQRVQARVSAALAALHVPATALAGPSRGLGGGGLAGVPPAVAARLQDAAVAGFHDVVWVLVAASALGVLVALLVRDPASASI
jgi:EmrB/QacA subfamily drug resistance transporter